MYWMTKAALPQEIIPKALYQGYNSKFLKDLEGSQLLETILQNKKHGTEV